MSAARYDLFIDSGEDFNFTLRVLDASDDPINFEGSAYIAEIREEHKKPLVAAFAVTPLGDGTLQLALTAAQTKLLSPIQQYKWDFFWTQSSLTTKLLYGTVDNTNNISNV